MTMEAEDKPLTPEQKIWLNDIWHSKQIESEYGDCPHCGRGNIEFKIWRLGDGTKPFTFKKVGYCPDCEAKYEEEQRRTEELTRTAEIATARRIRRETSGIPPKFMNEDFSTFQKGWQDKALKLCQSYAEKFPVNERPKGYKSLYIWSIGSKENPTGNGTGKSHLTCAIVHRILDRWQGETNKGCPRVVFLTELELFSRIRATYSFTYEEKQLRESEDDIIKRIIYADLVVLDDVGKEVTAKPDFVRKILLAIINGRYNQELPIIITANLAPEGLKYHLDAPPTEASYSRLFEMTGGEATRMDGKSYRRK